MHESDIPQQVIDRVMKRRGRLHAFDELEPRRTALVVVDMQNFFLEEGQACETPVAREIVPNINRLAAAARRAGGTVAWIRMTQDPAQVTSWSVFYEHLNEGLRGLEEIDRLGEGDHGHALWPALEIDPGDLIVAKNRFSAFIQGSSELHDILRRRDVDTVIVTGTVTNVCCQATALDAMMLNYKVVMVSDGNAALSDEAHRAVLATVFELFGDVRTTDEVIGLLEAGAKRPAAAE